MLLPIGNKSLTNRPTTITGTILFININFLSTLHSDATLILVTTIRFNL